MNGSNNDNNQIEEQNNFLHVNSINRSVRERKKKSLYIYEDMLKKCFRKVKLAVDMGERSCFYNVPERVLGKPSYKMTDCLKYMYDNVTKYGYYVKFIPPNVFFISWIHAYNDNYKPISNEHVVKTSYQQYLENTKITEEQERNLPKPALTNQANYQQTTYFNRAEPNTNGLKIGYSPVTANSVNSSNTSNRTTVTLQGQNQNNKQSAIDRTNPGIFNIVPRSGNSWIQKQQQQQQTKPEYKPLKFNNDLKMF